MRSNLFRILTILLILIYGVGANAQDKKEISGVVTSFKQLPLFKAKVFASKSNVVTYTDSSGFFRLQIPGKDVLIVSASGFKTRKTKVGKQSVLNIDLLFENNVVNFDNAVSNGHLSETSLKKAIVEAEKKNMKDYSKYSSIYELISSEIYNVQVRGTAITNKVIRSMNSNPQVLYVVEGKVVADISFVNTVDVKSIEFIDDVRTSMWGVQGANGVLSITLR
jgi:hypothetical protein